MPQPYPRFFGEQGGADQELASRPWPPVAAAATCTGSRAGVRLCWRCLWPWRVWTKVHSSSRGVPTLTVGPGALARCVHAPCVCDRCSVLRVRREAASILATNRAAPAQHARVLQINLIAH